MKNWKIFHENYQKIAGFHWFFKYDFTKFASFGGGGPAEPYTKAYFLIFRNFALKFREKFNKILIKRQILYQNYILNFVIAFLKILKTRRPDWGVCSPDALRGDDPMLSRDIWRSMEITRMSLWLSGAWLQLRYERKWHVVFPYYARPFKPSIGRPRFPPPPEKFPRALMYRKRL